MSIQSLREAQPVAWRPKTTPPINFVTGKPRQQDFDHWVGSVGCEIEYAYAAPQPPAKITQENPIECTTCGALVVGVAQMLVEQGAELSDERIKEVWADVLGCVISRSEISAIRTIIAADRAARGGAA